LFGGIEVSQAKRAEDIGKDEKGPVGKEVLTPTAKRKAVVHLMDAHGMSERRA